MSTENAETGQARSLRRQETGVVTSDTLDKTVVVTVERIGTHPLPPVLEVIEPGRLTRLTRPLGGHLDRRGRIGSPVVVPHVPEEEPAECRRTPFADTASLTTPGTSTPRIRCCSGLATSLRGPMCRVAVVEK